MRARSRRDFVRVALGGCFASAGILDQAVFRAAAARAQSAAAPSNLFVIEKVAEETYLALARPAAILNCNAAIFVNSRDVLVVDTHSKPSAAAALIAQIRREVTTKPVRYERLQLVASHPSRCAPSTRPPSAATWPPTRHATDPSHRAPASRTRSPPRSREM